MDIFNDICNALPRHPTEDNNEFWSNGELILCPTEELSNIIADFLEDVGVSDCMLTGYFDPEEDERQGEVDECTGYYYVDY